MISRRSWSASWALSRMTAGRAGDLLGRGVGAEFQCSRVDAEQGQPVGEDVVHLAGDGLAGEPLGLGGAQFGLGLGAAGPLAEGFDELAAGADEHAPGGDEQDEDEAEEDRDPGVEGGVGADEDLDGGGGDGERAEPGDLPEGAAYGDAEERREDGAMRRRGRRC